MSDHKVLPNADGLETVAEDVERLTVWQRVGPWRVHAMGRARRDGEGPEFTWRWIRGLWVLRDRAVAQLLQMPTRTLNQWVSRNPAWFPDDFAFWLEPSELFLYFTDQEYRYTQKARPPRVFSSAGMLQARLRRRPQEALPLLRALESLLPLAESAAWLTDPRLAPPPGTFFRPTGCR